MIPDIETVGGYSMCSSPVYLHESRMLDLAVKNSLHPPANWVHTKVIIFRWLPLQLHCKCIQRNEYRIVLFIYAKILVVIDVSCFMSVWLKCENVLYWEDSNLTSLCTFICWITALASFSYFYSIQPSHLCTKLTSVEFLKIWK